MNLNYLKYIFNRYKFFYVILMILFIAVSPMLNLFISKTKVTMLLEIIYIPTIIYFIIAYILPIWDFKQYYFQNIANIYFSLPDSRGNIYRTSTYFHIISNLIVYTLAISIGILVLYVKNIPLYYPSLFIYLGLSNVLFIAVYLFQSFIASRVYRIIDAIVLSVAYLALPAVVMFVIYFGLRQYETFLSWSKISFIGSVNHMTKYFTQFAISQFGQGFDNYFNIFIILGVAIFLHFLTIYRVNRLKPELIGSKTDSIFAYKILCPIYLFLVLLLANYEIGYFALAINLVLILSYCIFVYFKKHKLVLNYKYIIMYILFLGITNLIAFLVQ